MSELLARLQSSLGGTYRIERELGGGGMSRVFLAEEGRLGRRVVIKVLPPETSIGVHADRFEREIQVAASLQHPHIVPLLTAGATDADSGAGETPLLYYVMPFIEGESLATRIAREGMLPVGEVSRILRDIVDALAYAHARGVVHRDIKPDNILFAGRHALVADFGVAKAVTASSGPRQTTLTSHGVALGTPAYMAPEQAAADPNVDHRADLYAVGAVAYELLTGRTPFITSTPQAMLAAHVTATPDHVSAHRPSIPAEVAALVMRCLEKHPADRWQSAAELLGRLEAIATPSGGSTPAATAPVSAIRTSAETAIRRAHPARVAGLFLLATAVITALVFGATRAFGLPDWIWILALVVMLLGLPVMLYTGRLERQRAMQRATGAFRYEAEPAHQQFFTWRRAFIGGGLALGTMVLLASGFAVSRALGVGPAGTLLSSGRLKDTDRIVLAAFVNRTSDSTLASSVLEALRVDLGQSRVVQLLEPAEVRSALQRMGRDPLSELQEALALEVARREGAKAVVVGEISQLGRGYVLAARVVSADSGTTLVPVRETAASDAELIEAVNRLSAKLREEIGESLKSIRASEPLPQVTTASLAALQLYARGNRAFDETRYDDARALLERAVGMDTSFAMAWRKLSALYGNMGVDRSLQGDAARKAFEYRERLPPVERHLTAASYFWNVVREPERAIAEYQAVLDIDPDEPTALNNLGMILSAEGRNAEAEEPLRRGLSQVPRSTMFINLHGALIAQEKWEALDSLTRAAADVLPGDPLPTFMTTITAMARRDLGTADSITAGSIDSEDSFRWREMMFVRAGIASYRGKLRELESLIATIERSSRDNGDLGRAFDFAITPAFLDIVQRNQPERGLARLDALVEERFESVKARDRPYFTLAEAYAWGGRPEETRRMRAEWERSRERESWHPSDPDWWDAFVAFSEGRWRDAALAFSRAHSKLHCMPCGELYVAMSWDRAGEADSAIAHYERAYESPVTDNLPEDPTFMPIGLMRLGELHEAEGNREKALLYYEAFLELWRNADPELQPKVAEARRRIAALSAEPRS
ncbi:MAG TPA: serine/threonine-protein kinase [Gemmatimonadales bacterium]|nr:serine/threonine-protein kinase [Gemmatimonadales bacterium]